MPAEIITVGFCPQYYSQWKVTGSTGTIYDITLNGAEQMPFCNCKAFEFSKDGDCKHIRSVWEHGCLYNPQWKDPGPNDYKKHGIKLMFTDEMRQYAEKCPGCKEFMIPVRIAV